MDGLRQAWQGLKERLGAMTTNQRMVLGMVSAALIISASVFGLWLGREEQAVLFADLTAEDASKALAELNKRDVPAELTNGGTTIMVPASEVHRLRVDLVTEGIGSSGVVGYEIFDQRDYGVTPEEMEVRQLRALQGELTKTIESLSSVDAARVHLVMAQNSIFRSRTSEPSASVVLTLNRRTGITPAQVAGIRTMVAGGVEGLTADRVNVIDNNGAVLSDSYADDEYGSSDRQLELKKQVEDHLAAKAQAMLDGVLGLGRSQVQIDATLNFEKIESERTVFDPQATVVRSEERNESTDPQTGGTTEQSMTNYEINQTVERIVGEVGGVKQLTVAVSVDGTYEVPEGGGDPVYQPLQPEELDRIQRMVQTAVGLDAQRGDRIEVVNLQFQADRSAPAGGPGDLVGTLLDLVSRHGGRVLLIIMLGSMALVFRRNLAAMLDDLGHLVSGQAPELATATAGGGKAGGRKVGGNKRGDKGGAEESDERFEGLPEMTDQMIEDVREYAAENPARVAEVVQSWLYEPERNR